MALSGNLQKAQIALAGLEQANMKFDVKKFGIAEAYCPCDGRYSQ